MPHEQQMPDGWGWLAVLGGVATLTGGLVAGIWWIISKIWYLAEGYSLWRREHEAMLKTDQRQQQEIERLRMDLMGLEHRLEDVEMQASDKGNFSLRRALARAEQRNLIERRRE